MKLFDFWRKWLIAMGVLSALAGASLVLPALIELEFPHISSAFWQSSVVPDEVKPFYSWMFAVYSAMEIGWALFIVVVAYIPFGRKERWSWYCLFVCITAWFVVDTYFSLSFRVHDKAIGNLIFYLLMIVPLIFTWRHFHTDSPSDAAS